MNNSFINNSTLNKFLDESEDFFLVDDKIMCRYCEKSYNYIPTEGIRNFKRHLSSQSHLNKKKSKLCFIENSTSEITQESKNLKEFDLLYFMLKMDYSLSDLSNLVFKEFFEKYINIPLASESHYRQVLVPEGFTQKRNSLYEKINGKNYYLIVDSSINSKGKNILSIIIGICEFNTCGGKYLLDIIETELSTSESYAENIIQVLIGFFGNINLSKHFKMIITDQAPNMIKLGKILKNLYPYLLHVTCLAHMIHNICEKIRENSRRVDTIIVLLKKYLNKNKTNQKIFYEKTSLTIPNWPVITRWGTWLEFSKWIFENYAEIGKFFKEMDIKYKKDDFLLFDSKHFENEIRFCYDYRWLTIKITQLESNDLSVEEQVQILNFIKENLQHDFLKVYFDTSLSKNPDINFFINFNQLRATREEKHFSHVPLNSVEVERSFSAYRKLFCDQRKSLKTENLRMLLFLYFNKNL